MNTINFAEIKKVYFVGIKGSGIISLVEIMHHWGKVVSGSDVAEKFFTDEILDRLQIQYYEGFSQDNLNREAGIDLVIYSTAYNPENNEELQAAKTRGLLCLSYPEAVGAIMQTKFSLAVCGTHGKTTTTAMLTLALQAAGADPTAIIGSKINQLGSSGLVGESQYLVVEADEYQNKFLHYNPMAVILTSLDFDHPDFFPTFENYKETFQRFVAKIPAHGFLVVWGGSVDTLDVAKFAKCKVIVYGDFENQEPATFGQSDLERRIRDEFQQLGKDNIEFVAMPADLNLQIPGKHNRLNATAVLACCRQLKLDEAKVLASLQSYQGTARRFERLGQYNGAQIIDDYAHHPEEIRATLAAAREVYPNEHLICVFHPHTFTRTKALLEDFSQSFSDCSEVIVLDIYGSARENQGEIHAQDLVNKIKMYQPNVEYLATIDDAYENLKKRLGDNDVLITMGAGNVNELAKKLISKK